jgi:hypothetical protein
MLRFRRRRFVVVTLLALCFVGLSSTVPFRYYSYQQMAAAAGSAAGTTAYLPLVKTVVGGIPAGSYIQDFTG